jgi:hypothetical protein
MKRLLAMFLIVGIAGCCTTQQSYTIPPSKTRAEFLLDKEVCANLSGYKGGTFDSPPLILLYPFVKISDLIEGNRQNDFQDCMVERGYKRTDWWFGY